MTSNVTIRIQDADFDVAREIAALTASRTDIGAVVTFSGICRGQENLSGSGDATTALTLEHYPGMAEAEIARHAEEAMTRWPLTGLTIVHRVGRILPGENIMVVLTASAHRQAAFQAAEFLMDYLKAHAPFWKREETAGGSNWIAAKTDDDDAAARWDKN
ncbi:molybdenum cofactor biosynthesis protein MoaE [Tardiphaga sp. P9-11]|jgi:molybdopterin synthase catalytic subunit|uniref:molybdenum cofactor biosynthesis protein MoaE n=1 Tax=Tardiphaga sp. P9-11 TaxID=2024614 RepID=UPI0011F2EA1D|nr:molybdenum cofactor biosynthesis protein MoaE [Tardiphaga sp. P9-11]KAA0075240.1 molybdenum cofactor biosynthesis protein MoaE [Tardiphaga sp. P9-11]